MTSSLSNVGRSTLSSPNSNPHPNQVNRAFTKGLYGVDPQQLQKKQNKSLQYQNQLKKQVEQVKRRKAEQKAKQRLQDEKLQRKIDEIQAKTMVERQQEINKRKRGGGGGGGVNGNPFGGGQLMLPQHSKAFNNNNNNNESRINNNSKNINNSKSVESSRIMIGSSANGSNQQQQQQQFQQINNLIHQSFPFSQSQSQIPLNSHITDPYQLQEQNYMKQQHQNRLKRFKESLDQKVQEIYKQIEVGKSTAVGSDYMLDDIRRRLRRRVGGGEGANGGQGYGYKQYEQWQKRQQGNYGGHRSHQNASRLTTAGLKQSSIKQQLTNSSIKPFEQEFSQFYKIPNKKSHIIVSTDRDGYGSRIQQQSWGHNQPIRNLDYDSQSFYHRQKKNHRKSDQQQLQNLKNDKSDDENTPAAVENKIQLITASQQPQPQNNVILAQSSYVNQQQQEQQQHQYEQNQPTFSPTRNMNKKATVTPKKWGVQKKQKFLGNRQALDYKINSMLSGIDNILNDQNIEQAGRDKQMLEEEGRQGGY